MKFVATIRIVRQQVRCGEVVSSEITLYELISLAFIEIREASISGNLKKSFALSDLFHNVPSHLIQVKLNQGTYDEVFNTLKIRAEMKNLSSWHKIKNLIIKQHHILQKSIFGINYY